MSVTQESLKKSNSSSSFSTAIVVNGALLLVEVGAFVFLKQRLWRIYTPRTQLPPPDKRAQELPGGWWRWLPALIKLPSQDIIHKNGLDAYMFLRFLKMLIYIFFVFTLVTFATIVPLNYVGIQYAEAGIERITWTNVDDAHNQRLAGHVVVVYLLTFFVFWMIKREMNHFLHMRHQFLVSKSHSRLAQARTVLITAVPDELASERDIRQFASFVPGGIDRVWIYRDSKLLNKEFEARQKACKKLETAEAKVLKMANDSWRRKETAHAHAQKMKPKDKEGQDEKLIVAPASHEFLNELVPVEKRPTHKLGFLGLFGKKVDTIDWCKDEIARLNPLINEQRQHVVKGKFLGSVFIRCNLQMGAHILAQVVSYHKPFVMYDKWMEAHPKDIVWANLDDGALEMTSRYVTSWMASFAMIVAWTFPVGFVGTLSNLDDLCVKVHWLAWVCTGPVFMPIRAPSPWPGLIQGILPPLLLAILFALVPLILRGLAWYECIPRYSLMSISVYRRFYFFLLVHGFLVVTLSSGITKAIQAMIDNPTEAVQTLANQLPGASVFFLTYMTTQGLAGAGMALVQLVPILLHFVRKWFLGRTPRQAYEVTFKMPEADFGTILPRLSLLAAIGFAYSVLNPMINLLALISYMMFYMAFKFLLTQVFDQPDQSETGGMYFPMAVSNLFVGLYIQQVCMACLYFLKASVAKRTSIIEGSFMILLIFITVAAQTIVTKSYDPISTYLPMSLATKKMAKRYESERRKMGNVETDGEMDLFSRDTIRSVRKRVRLLPKKLDDKLGDLKSDIQAKVRGSTDEPPRTSRSEDKQRESVQIERVEEEPSAETTGAAPRPLPVGGDPELFRQHSTTSHASKSSSTQKTSAAPRPLEGAPELFREPSTKSHLSNSSENSKRSSEKLRRTRVFDPPAPAVRRDQNEEDDDDDGSSDEEAYNDDHAFDHPSTYVEQPWIWLPHDRLGFSTMFVEELKSVGVDASDVGAVMDEKGVVEVTRNPPDEEWTGGHDL